MARINEPRNELDLLDRLNLLNEERRIYAEFGITLFDRILVGAVRINDLVALYENKFPLVNLQFRQFVLVRF